MKNLTQKEKERAKQRQKANVKYHMASSLAAPVSWKYCKSAPCFSIPRRLVSFMCFAAYFMDFVLLVILVGSKMTISLRFGGSWVITSDFNRLIITCSSRTCCNSIMFDAPDVSNPQGIYEHSNSPSVPEYLG